MAKSNFCFFYSRKYHFDGKGKVWTLHWPTHAQVVRDPCRAIFGGAIEFVGHSGAWTFTAW